MTSTVTKDDDRLLCRKEAAKYLGGFSPETLAVWDCTKRYHLNPIKIGRTVRYWRSDLDKFALSQTVKTIKEQASNKPRCDADKLAQQ